jgi:hypothetical protein
MHTGQKNPIYIDLPMRKGFRQSRWPPPGYSKQLACKESANKQIGSVRLQGRVAAPWFNVDAKTDHIYS